MASDGSKNAPAVPTHQVVRPDPVTVNVGPMGFYLWAQDFYDCRQSYTPANKFSPVPYFLLCRSTELALKSLLLHEGTRQQVKDDHGHSIVSCYRSLPDDGKILDPGEMVVLEQADVIYRKKGLEYFTIVDFQFPLNLKGRPKLPDLEALDQVTAKLLAASKKQVGLHR